MALKIPLNMVGDRGTTLRLKHSGSTDVQISVGVDNTLVLYDATYPAGLRLEDILVGAIVGGTFLPSVRGNLKFDVGLTRPTNILRLDYTGGTYVNRGDDPVIGTPYWLLPIVGTPQPTSINLYINGLLYGSTVWYPGFTGIYTSGYWHIEMTPGVFVDMWGVLIDESEVMYSSTYLVNYDKKLYDTLGLQVMRRNTVSYDFAGTLPVEVAGNIEHTFTFPAPTPSTDPDDPFNWILPTFVEMGDFDFYRNGLKEPADRLAYVLPNFTDPINHTITIGIVNAGSYLDPTDTIIFSYPYLYTIPAPTP